jgi:hypothetical protein
MFIERRLMKRSRRKKSGWRLHVQISSQLPYPNGDEALCALVTAKATIQSAYGD